MFISKYCLDNPQHLPSSISKEMHTLAKTLYEYFESNNLFYINTEKRRPHILFAGGFGVEVSKRGVLFNPEVKLNDFKLVRINDTVTMVRFKKSLKPMIYYPVVPGTGIAQLDPQEMSMSERYLFDTHPSLTEHCLFNRGAAGWSIDMCQNNYPVETCPSLSRHVVKFHKWFEEKHGIYTGYKTRVMNNRVSLVRFSF